MPDQAKLIATTAVTYPWRFGTRSERNIETLDDRLQRVVRLALALSPIDFGIIWGHRGETDQEAAWAAGNSKLRWPESKHNANPSLAFDFAPWIGNEIPWRDTHAFAVVAGCIFAAARIEDVEVRWGGDWDMDGRTTDSRLKDWGHFELTDSWPPPELREGTLTA